jgi:phosphatidylserine/phosphatidylglycerophosphate/cardiolipin synthase-like enzyme
MRDDAIADFRQQLEFGIPTSEAEKILRKLVEQLRSHRLQLKQFMRYPLHAKLYIVHRDFHGSEMLDYVGSSNLTLAGLTGQGELNIDVADQDAARKLSDWFEERWADPLNEDLSLDLADLIADSWAGDKLREPYLVYLKMAYHLSVDARKGEEQFKLPDQLQKELLNYQVKAVQLVCRRLRVPYLRLTSAGRVNTLSMPEARR